MNLLSASLYWIAVVIWTTVLLTVIVYYIRNPRTFGAARLLLIVVVIDTVRNIVENVYFGSYWGGQFGLFPAEAVAFLGHPPLMMLPKALNIVAGSFVLGLLVMRWLPAAVRERATAEKRIAIAESEAHGFAAVMDRMSMPILVLDALQSDRPVVFANRAYLTASNRTAADMIGHVWRYHEAVNPQGAEVAALHAAITEARQAIVTIPCRRPDGALYDGRCSVTPIADAAGHVTLLVVMCEGVIEHTVASEAGDNQVERERIVGKLAESVAHDFNNLLAVMLSSLETVRHTVAPNTAAGSAVDLTVRAVQRSSRLARRLMDYSLNRASVREVVDVRHVIENLQPLLVRALTSSYPLTLDLGPDPMPCRIEVGRLEDALINLCINARDAFDDEGDVNITTRRAPDENMAVIAVADNGRGMTPEVAARALERNFTTKAPGQGSGLGLASVDEFVRASGGSIAIDTAPGAGTTVTLKLPLAG